MKRDTIIAYNEKILDLVLSNSSFDELIFCTFPNGKELTRLKNNFDLLGVRTGKSRLKQDEIRKSFTTQLSAHLMIKIDVAVKS